jgi:hypothetical protein
LGAKEAWLRTFLALPGGIPSHDTFGRVFARLDPDELRRCSQGWAAAVAGAPGRQVVAADGKTLRRSHDRQRGKSAPLSMRVAGRRSAIRLLTWRLVANDRPKSPRTTCANQRPDWVGSERSSPHSRRSWAIVSWSTAYSPF